MKITAIKLQLKRTGRVSIFVDGKYSFALSESALLESKLYNGQEISREELNHFKEIADTDKLYRNTLRFTVLRLRSEWEITEYLQRKKSPALLTATILSKLSKNGLVNDEEFATRWVGNRRLLKPTSRRRLTAELRSKHVANDIIERVLGADETNEREILQELVVKKNKQVKYQDNKLKLMQYLARQGFSYEDIKSVLSEET